MNTSEPMTMEPGNEFIDTDTDIRSELKHVNVDSKYQIKLETYDFVDAKQDSGETMIKCEEVNILKFEDLSSYDRVNQRILNDSETVSIISDYEWETERKCEVTKNELANTSNGEVFTCNGNATNELQQKDGTDIDALKLFQCSECSYKCRKRYMLKTHMLVHKKMTKIEMFSCDECDFKTKSKYRLTKHILRHKDGADTDAYKFQCNECSYKCRHEYLLKRHTLTHKNITEVEIFTCGICDLKTKRKDNLKKHMLRHKDGAYTDARKFQCSECTSEFRNQYLLERHILKHKKTEIAKQHFGEATIKCEEVNIMKSENLSSYNRVNQKIFDDSTSEPVSIICDYEWETEQKSEVNKKEVANTCNGEVFTYDLKNHEIQNKYIYDDTKYSIQLETVDIKLETVDFIDVKQNFGEAAIKCEEVNIMKSESLSSDDRVNQEEVNIIKSKTKIKMFSCDECDYKTKRKYWLTKHMLRHKDGADTDAYRFQCSDCIYKCRKRHMLKTHMLVHKKITEIEMFTCDECDFKTKRKYGLTKHMFRHKDKADTDAYKFQCNECTYKCRQQYLLKRHILSHKNITEVEMFTCGVCDFKTKSKDCLKKHMLRHTDGAHKFQCNECTSEFRHLYLLKSHMRRHKKNKIADQDFGVKAIGCEEVNIVKSEDLSSNDKVNQEIVDDSTSEPVSIIGSYKWESERKCEVIKKELANTINGEDFTCNENETKSMDDLKTVEIQNNYIYDDTKYKIKLETVDSIDIKQDFGEAAMKCEEVNIFKSKTKIDVFSCSERDFKTKCKDVLKNHILQHKDGTDTDVQKFQCSECTYKCRKRHMLKTHMLVHKKITEIEMFTCNECDFKTKRKYSLAKHMLCMHKDGEDTDAYKFQCSECTYKSRYQYMLTRHIVSHRNITEVEMFICGICDYKTKRKACLKIHLLRHKDGADIDAHKFQCNECSSIFKHRYLLRRHMLQHKKTEIEMFICGLCDFRTKHKPSLREHILRHKDRALIDTK